MCTLTPLLIETVNFMSQLYCKVKLTDHVKFVSLACSTSMLILHSIIYFYSHLLKHGFLFLFTQAFNLVE